MLTQAQIVAQSTTPALTDEQVQSLVLLVKRWKVYRANVGLWPNFEARIVAEQSAATVKTKALKAVLALLAQLPSIVVESQGTEDAQSHFSTELNWDSLARTVLDTLFDVPLADGRTHVALVQRTIPNMILNEDFFVSEKDTGTRL